MSHGNTSFALRVGRLRVLEESDEWSGSDEPYVVAWVADLTPIGNVVIPRSRIDVTGPWGDADAGELKTTLPAPNPESADALRSAGIVGAENLWGFDGTPAPIPNAANLLVLVGIMEHDQAKPESVGTVVNGMMAGNLVAAVNDGLTNAQLRGRLRDEFTQALDAARLAGFGGGDPNFDDRVADAQELRLTHARLDRAAAAGTFTLPALTFDGGGQGSFRVAFDLVAGG